MKTSSIFLILILSSLIFQPLFLAKIGNAALSNTPPEINLCGNTGGQQQNFRTCILEIGKKIVVILMYIALVISGIFLVWGGILFITEGKADNAKNKVLFAIIGLVVALLSWGIVRIIEDILTNNQNDTGL